MKTTGARDSGEGLLPGDLYIRLAIPSGYGRQRQTTSDAARTAFSLLNRLIFSFIFDLSSSIVIRILVAGPTAGLLQPSLTDPPQ